jgi:hypothetical protein
VEEISFFSPVELLLATSGCKAIPESGAARWFTASWLEACICWQDCKAHDSHISSWDKGPETSIWLSSWNSSYGPCHNGIQLQQTK